MSFVVGSGVREARSLFKPWALVGDAGPSSHDGWSDGQTRLQPAVGAGQAHKHDRAHERMREGMGSWSQVQSLLRGRFGFGPVGPAFAVRADTSRARPGCKPGAGDPGAPASALFFQR